MTPLRIFTGEEVLLPGYFAEYPGSYYDAEIRRISKEEFEKLKAMGIPVTGWFARRRKRTLWDFEVSR